MYRFDLLARILRANLQQQGGGITGWSKRGEGKKTAERRSPKDQHSHRPSAWRWGSVMKSISFALALLAAIGIVAQPIVPAYAVSADEPVHISQPQRPASQLVVGETLDEFILNSQMDRDTRDKLADHAQLGEAAIISQAQMNDLARTHPSLHAKLMNAYRTLSVPRLTADERRLVNQITAGNLAAFKAGDGACMGAAIPVRVAGTLSDCGGSSGGTTSAWIVVALMLALIIGVPLFCALFGNPPICRGFGGP